MQPKWLASFTSLTREFSPEILSGCAIAGVLTTAYLAIRATPRAVERLEETDPAEKILRRQQAAIVWRYYIPAGLSAAGTIACIIGAGRIGSRRNAGLVAGMALADRAFRDYKEEVRELIGERKELEVREHTAQKQIDEHPPSTQVIITGGGDQLCFDTFTGRYFRSDLETIRRAEIEINARIFNDMYASQNEFYSLVGLPDVIAGEEFGWNIEHRISLVFTAHLAEDGKPCIAVGYEHLPVPQYGKVF